MWCILGFVVFTIWGTAIYESDYEIRCENLPEVPKGVYKVLVFKNGTCDFKSIEETGLIEQWAMWEDNSNNCDAKYKHIDCFTSFKECATDCINNREELDFTIACLKDCRRVYSN